MNTTIQGHWYCSYCNDVVNIQKPVGRYDAKQGVRCPDCGHNSANWVPARVGVEPGQTAAELFQKLREAAK